MTNISKEKREKMIAFLEQLRQKTIDDISIIALNEIENALTEKKYGLVWEEHSEQVDEELKTKIPVFKEIKEKEIISNSELPYNFLLEGDNLHSLYLLEKTHKHKIDVIYIDPPYNTGAKNWKYNNNYVEKEDGYRHSKWISMMAERLIKAKEILKDSGVLICAIDENEIANIKLLLEDIFGYAYQVDVITIVQNPRGIQGDNFSYVNEFALFVYKKGKKVIFDKNVEAQDVDWSPLRNWGSESERTDAKNCFYGIKVKNGKIIEFEDVLEDLDSHPEKNVKDGDAIVIYPIDDNGVERKWRYARQSVEEILPILRIKEKSNGELDVEIGKPYAPYKTVWTSKKYDANEYGTQLLKSMVPTSDFDFPKSIWNVYECLYATTKNKKDALILDFFAGSGTTGHAVELLNKMDGGKRRYILATNNDVGEEKKKIFEKSNGIKISDNLSSSMRRKWDKYVEKYGICTSVTYPRLRATIEGYVHSKGFITPLFERKLNKTFYNNFLKIKEDIEHVMNENKSKYDDVEIKFEENLIKVLGKTQKNNFVEGLSSNLKYYKTTFISRLSDEIDLKEALLEYVPELIQIQNAINIDDKNYVLILSEEDAKNILINQKHCDKYKTIYISSSVLLDSKQKRMLRNTKSYVYTVPDYYFESELREAGEI